MSQATVMVNEETAIPIAEIVWQFSRSSGPGGQNVNKTATRVELLFDVGNSPSLSAGQKERVRRHLGRLIDSSGVLHLTSQESASQWQNRESALARFAELMMHALRPARVRVRTRTSRAQKARRRDDKRRQSEKKRRRSRSRVDDW